MRLPSLESDFWQLRSGEALHAESPDTFWIPPLEQRQTLRPGAGVKLVFEIKGLEDNGKVNVQRERMWVIVTAKHSDVYIGRLDNEPSIEPGDDVYLQRGAEVPFRAEHVVDIQAPPADYVAARLAEAPTRRWPSE